MRARSMPAGVQPRACRSYFRTSHFWLPGSAAPSAADPPVATAPSLRRWVASPITSPTPLSPCPIRIPRPRSASGHRRSATRSSHAHRSCSTIAVPARRTCSVVIPPSSPARVESFSSS